MVSVRLPDGSQRQFDAPVTVAQVAASIGTGLAKAALAGKVDGKVIREQAVEPVENHRCFMLV